MLRQKLVRLFNDEGKHINTVTLNKLRELSIEELQGYSANLSSAMSVQANYLLKSEVRLVLVFQPTLADPSVDKHLDNLTASNTETVEQLQSYSRIYTAVINEKLAELANKKEGLKP